MNSNASYCKSEFKNYLALNVNYSNSISKIFQNELGVEIFTKRIETSEECIAPFDMNQCQSVSKFEARKENKENFISKKRRQWGPRNNGPYQFYESSSSGNRGNFENFRNNPSLNNFGTNREKEFISSKTSSDYLLSEKIENSLDCSKVDPRWTKKEEINFIGVCLVYKLFSEKLKLSNLLVFVPTRTKKQFYRHFYGNKNSMQIFSDIFFDYCNMTNPELYSDLQCEPQKVNQMHHFFTKKIFEKEFIKYFNEKVKDEKCQNYFENIYEYITLEPRVYLKFPKKEEDIYLSPKSKKRNSCGNSSQGILKNSNRNKSSKDKISSNYKIENEVVVSNLTFRIEEKLYDNLLSLSKSEFLVIDEFLLFEYAMKKF
jgi:hypothetical protein